MFGFMLWTTALNSVCLALVMGLIVAPQLLQESLNPEGREHDWGECEQVVNGIEAAWVPKGQEVQCCSRM